MQIIAMIFSGEELITLFIGMAAFAGSAVLSLVAAILAWFPKNRVPARWMAWGSIALYLVVIFAISVLKAEPNSPVALVAHLPAVISALVLVIVLLAAPREDARR